MTQEQWFKSGQHEILAEALNQPIVHVALAMIEQSIRPNNALVGGVVNANLDAPNIAARLAYLMASNAGSQWAIDELRRLAKAPPIRVPREIPEPFGHIKPDYLEGNPESAPAPAPTA